MRIERHLFAVTVYRYNKVTLKNDTFQMSSTVIYALINSVRNMSHYAGTTI
jgi:hypothetical protein